MRRFMSPCATVLALLAAASSSRAAPLFYNGPGNGTDQAFAIAVDGAGNVYATGSAIGAAGNSDFATVKYSPAGRLLWSRLYNGPGNGCAGAGEALIALMDATEDPVVRLTAWSGLARLGREEAWEDFEAVLAATRGEVTAEMVLQAALEHRDARLREPLQRAAASLELAEPVRARILAVVAEYGGG